MEVILRRLAAPEPAVGDAERIDRIALLERIKHAASAAQARESVAFDAGQREAQTAAGVLRDRIGRGVAEQVALARGESPHAGSRLLGLATALVREMPHTLSALAAGDCSEWRATIMVRETAHLEVADRAAVDSALGPRLGSLGTRAVEREARALAQRLDAAAAVARASRVAADRCVTVRPAPDTMTFLTAHLPVSDGVAVYAALDAEARRLVGAGDGRGRGQIMADTLVERVTGRTRAQGHPIEVGLVMTDRALLGGADDPARLFAPGVAPQTVPAGLARLLVRGPDEGPGGDAVTAERARVWVRRLYVSPDERDLVAMDSRRREFDGLLRRMLVLRDQTCRTPFCDAPIRHADHVRPHRVGGSTSLLNAAGLCERCNQVKEVPGWSGRVVPQGSEERAERRVRQKARRLGHEIALTTPTGHVYRSLAPPMTTAVPTQLGVAPGISTGAAPTRLVVLRRCRLSRVRRLSATELGCGQRAAGWAGDG